MLSQFWGQNSSSESSQPDHAIQTSLEPHLVNVLWNNTTNVAGLMYFGLQAGALLLMFLELKSVIWC